ncbi:MAG: hypothetical protein DI539_24095 [Flavobacterium psychrophilum]|jgi:hypothetical protein|nr:MAG: hypothetical protein DI539_24095 [Flavobacterium psychrophilum]
MTKEEEYLDVTLKGSELLDSIKEDLIEFLSNPKSQKVYQSKDLLNKVYKQIVANLYAANEITQAEVKDKEIVKSKVVRFLKRNKLSIVTTHTQGILNQADQFHKNGKIDFALIF